MKAFSKLKDRIKGFFSEMTLASKLKYVVVAVILLVAVAAVAVVGTAGNEEVPEATVSTESLTIDFDEEIVINFGADEDETSDVAESADVTETEPAEESSEAESTESSDAESTEAESEESTADTASAPSEDTDPTADVPEETVSADTEKTETQAAVVHAVVTEKPQVQTPVTEKPVVQTPVTQAPVTQAPATQAPVTQAPVTQAPVTQAPVTQAPVTQAPVTQKPVTQKPATQKPVEEPEESKNYGNWVVKQKKYYYDAPIYTVTQLGNEYPNGPAAGNVVILSVENKSNEAYTVTISGKYLDANGNVLKTENKTFEGFAANWSNYFVFAPGIEFDKFTFDFSAKKYSGDTKVQYLVNLGTCSVSIGWAMTDGSGREVYPTSGAEMDSLKQVVSVAAGVKIRYKGPGVINYWGDIVFFDKNGNIAYIRDAGHGNITYDPSVSDESGGGLGRPLFLTDIPYSDVGSYKIPDELSGMTAIFAVVAFEDM